jgi:UDP-glucose 4-epimerase
MGKNHARPLEGKSALVTGASGFIGRALSARLRKEGCRVTGADTASGFDVCDWSSLAKLRRRRFDVVYHLAGLMHVPTSWHQPRETFTTNVLGTLHVLEFCRLTGVPRLVFVSSAMYGPPQYLPIDEDHPVDPTNPYSWSKATAEDLCRAYGKLFGLNIIILRPFNVYGPGQRTDFLISSVVEQVKTKGAARVHDVAPKRDYLHIDDMVDAFVRAGAHKQKGVRTFNVGSGKSHSVDEVLDAVFAAADRPRRVKVTGRKRRGEVADVVADIGAARRGLRWKPTMKLQKGIEKMMR